MLETSRVAAYRDLHVPCLRLISLSLALSPSLSLSFFLSLSLAVSDCVMQLAASLDQRRRSLAQSRQAAATELRWEKESVDEMILRQREEELAAKAEQKRRILEHGRAVEEQRRRKAVRSVMWMYVKDRQCLTQQLDCRRSSRRRWRCRHTDACKPSTKRTWRRSSGRARQWNTS